MRLKFRCGCPAVEFKDVDKAPVKCPACGSRGVTRVLGAPLPRFVGHGRGPLLTSKALEPIEVKLAPKGALTLKPRKDDADGRSVSGRALRAD